MVSFFPKQIRGKAILIYLLSLVAVSLIFLRHMMGVEYLIMGIVWVLFFFFLSVRYTTRWLVLDEKRFVRKLFFTGLIYRVVWVIFSYFFYIIKTGIPFEFSAADSLGYHNTALWFNEIGWSATVDYLSVISVGDAGYQAYLGLLYSVFGGNIIITRIIKALLSAWTCVLVYQLAKRNMGDEVGRMASIFCCLAPNLIMYCGLHLKETEMIFLTIAALERADNLLRGKQIDFWQVLLVALLALSLFTFRTVLGGAVLFAILTSIVFSTTTMVGRWNRVVLVVWAVLALSFLAGGTIANEAQGLWETRNENQMAKRRNQEVRGAKWAKYATGTVMAPMMFVLPFPTMVDVDEQYTQQMMSGGNYVRTFFGIFVLIALFNALFVKKNWRDLTMIGAFVIAYLGIISTSGFSGSERFLLPGLPFLLMMAAYGVSLLNERNYRFVRYWYIFVPVMIIGWAVFKLGSRSML